MTNFAQPFAGVKKIVGERPLFTILLEPKDVLSRTENSLLALENSGDLVHFIARVANSQISDTYFLPPTNKFQGQSALLYSPDYSLLSVFSLGQDGYTYQSWQQRESDNHQFPNWSAWTALPKTRKFVEGVAALNSPDGELASVFSLGQDGYIYQIVYQRGAGGGWQNWTRLPGNKKFASAPAAMNSPDGTLASVFAMGQDLRMYQIVYSRKAGGGWKSWNKLTDSRNFASAPAVMNSPDGKMASVFARGDDDYIYQCIFARKPGGSWGNWNKVPGNQKFQSNPVVINSPDGQKVTLYALDLNKQVHQIVYSRESGAGWGSWTQILGASQYDHTPIVLPTVLHRRSRKAISTMLFGTGNKSVRGYFKENSYGDFKIKNGFMTPWLTASDDPGTPKLDESSYEFMHAGGEKVEEEKGKWIIKEVEKQKLTQYSNFAHNGRIDREDLTFLWLYSGGRLGSGRQRDLPSISSGLTALINAEVLARGEHHCGPTLIAHELGHAILNLHDLYDGLWISSMAMAGSNDRVYCWTYNASGDGAVYSGRPTFLSRNGRKTFKPPAGLRLNQRDLIATAMAGSNDHVYVWYKKDKKYYVSSGTTTDLDCYRQERNFNLPPGKNLDDIVDIGINKNDLVVTWYDDNTWSKGTTEDLSAHQHSSGSPLAPYDLPAGKSPSDICGIAISSMTDHAYTWYKDGTYSVGLFSDLASVDSPAPCKLPPEAYPGPSSLSLMAEDETAFIPHLDPWSKMKLGWLKPQIVTTSGLYPLYNIEMNRDNAYILYNPAYGPVGDLEYFIVENRWPGSSSEAALAHAGIAIWHIHERNTDGAGTPHVGRKTVQLVKPGGINAGVADSLWHAGDPKLSYDLTSDSIPANTRWDDGTSSGIEIKNFSTAGQKMTVYFKVP